MRSTFPLSILLASSTTPCHERSRSAHVVPPTSPVFGLAGMWKGMLFPPNGAPATAFSMLQEVQEDGTVAGRIEFAGPRAQSIPVRLLEASASTYVALVGPYVDRTTGAERTTLIEGRKSRNKIWGEYTARDGLAELHGRFVAVRCMIAGR